MRIRDFVVALGDKKGGVLSEYQEIGALTPLVIPKYL